MNPVEAVFFDVGWTLSYPHRSLWDCFAEVIREEGFETNSEEVEKTAHSMMASRREQSIREFLEGAEYPDSDEAFEAIFLAMGHIMLKKSGLGGDLDALTRDVLGQYKGREIQHTGDGFMVSFTAASQAVGCAIAIQKSMHAHNQGHPDTNINVRIGVCAGEPVEEDQRLFGSTVQLTSRICDKAQPDQILVAPVVRDLCLGKQFAFKDQGEFDLKGFDQPQRMYEVQWQD